MQAQASHILIVDDDLRIRQLLRRYLEERGFRATAVADVPALERQLEREPCDLIVLDLMLKDEDGMALCRRLRRAEVTTPIIMLTAKGGDADRIRGLDSGADDYLPKPFNPGELLARIRAVLRRVPRLPPGAPAADRAPSRFGPYVFDPVTRELQREGVAIPLTTGDFALLKALVTHAHRPLSRAVLAKLAQGRDHDPCDRNIDVRISRLRKLIEADTDRPRYIQTIWGYGYVFVPDGSKQ